MTNRNTYTCGVDQLVQQQSDYLDELLQIEDSRDIIMFTLKKLPEVVEHLRASAGAAQVKIELLKHVAVIEDEHDRLHVQEEHLRGEIALAEAGILERYIEITRQVVEVLDTRDGMVDKFGREGVEACSGAGVDMNAGTNKRTKEKLKARLRQRADAKKQADAKATKPKRKTKVKVYGWNGWLDGKQTREVVATTSKKRVRQLVGNWVPLSEIVETGNEAEIEQAMTQFEVVFWHPIDQWNSDRIWRPVGSR